MKKVLSLFLTVVFVLSMFSCLTVVSFAATSDLVVDQEYTVASETTLTFIPEESGSYLFQSLGYGDPRITISCVNGEYAFDDENDMDFYGIVDLEAGEEVSCYLYNYDSEDCVFKITKIATPKVTFTPVEPLTVVENTNGYWEGGEYWDDETEDWVWVDYYYYYMPDAFYREGNTFTVEYPDGTTDVYTCYDMGEYVNSAGDWLDYNYDNNQSAESYWTVGSHNCFYVEVFGKRVKVPVTITENPCESIEFIPAEPFEIMEGINGEWEEEWYWDEDDNEVYVEYYYYDVGDMFYCYGNTIVVNYKDGTSDSYTYQEYYNEEEDYYSDWYINASGERLACDYRSNQGYDNQWSVGSDNCFTVEAFGKEVEVPVTIIENPYESIEFIPAKPLEIIENTNGDWEQEWDWDDDGNEVYVDYYSYYVGDLFRIEGNTIVVNHKDGTRDSYTYQEYYNEEEECYSDEYVNSAGEVLNCDYSSDQSYNNRWTLGSDNYFTVEAFGKEVEVPVTIIENPYESIEFIPAEPFEIVEKTNGYWEEDWYWDDEAENEVYVDYYHYDVGDLISAEGNSVIVNYKDGTSDSYTYQECYNEEDDSYYNAFVNAAGEELDYSYSSNQEYNNQWTIGSDNYFIFEALGKEVQVPVTLIENPYESIEFISVNPLYFEQYTNGYWTTYDDEEIFCYDVYELINAYGNIIRLNKKDGTSEEYTCSWRGYENSDGEYLDVDYSSNHWDWCAGGDNYITISANGVECTVYVTITAESTTIQESSFVAEKVSEDTCVITEIIESDDFDGTLDIPETVNGCTAIGIDNGVLGNVEGLKTVNLPASFNMISEDTFNWCDALEAINVSADNAVFASVNGVLYNKALTEIIYCPQNFKGVFVIKAGVTDIPSEALVGLGNASSVQIEAGNTAFAQEDGILYNSTFTKIYKAFDVEGDYVMKSTVEEVADYAFSGKDKIESVAFSSGVTEISYGAFSGCTALESVDLPDALVSIGIDAFSNNTSLGSVTLPATTKEVEENAFRDCSSLQVINLNNGIEYIGVDAFNNADIRKLVLPDSLTGMGSKCFGNNANLSEVTIGAGLTSIAGSAFEDCVSLKNIDIPETITHLGYYAFAGTGLTNITLHDDMVDIERAFAHCKDLKTAYVGSGILYVMEAFDGCENLETVEFGEGFNGSGKYAFRGCKKLAGLELPETVTNISYGQFKGCESLDELDLPDDLLLVGAHSFDNTGLYNNHADGVVYVDHVAYSYKGTMPASYTLNIKNGTKSIAENAFENQSNIVSIQLPYTLEYIGSYAFYKCSGLTNVTIPGNVKYIEESAFFHCPNLTSVTILGDIERIEWFAMGYSEYGSKIENFTIYGIEDSAAEEYAELHEFNFIAIEGHTHTPSDWIIDKYATCTENGSKHKECTDCGETLETAVIAATGHTAVKDAAVAATCTTAGKTEGSHCSVCNTVIVAQQTVPAKGHTSSALKYNEKTRTEYKECTVCKVVLESKYIPVPTTQITSCYNEVKGVQLKWNAVSDATSYKIYRKLPSQTAWTLIRTETGLAYQDTAVTGNTVYQYVIKAVDKYGNESAYSAQRECRFIATPELASRESAVGGVKITWEKVAGATSYRIYRRGAGTDYWYYLGDVNATQNTFFDKESSLVSSGNYYRYTVRASYSGKDSAGKDYLIYSGFDTNGLYLKYVATPKLTSISNATGGLQIKWNAVNGNGRMEYRVYRRGAGSTYWKYLGTTTSTTWTDAEVKNASGSYYRYTVRAVQGTNGSGWYSAFDTAGLYLKRLANPTLKSAVSSKAGITVKWNAVTGTTGYYVYRKTANSGWTRIATVSGTNNTTYLDKTAKKGVTYVYTVRAVYGTTTSWFNSGISCKDKY